MKCVIFGGGGFIGSAIVDRLLLERQHLPSNRMKNRLSKRYTHLNPTDIAKKLGRAVVLKNPVLTC